MKLKRVSVLLLLYWIVMGCEAPEIVNSAMLYRQLDEAPSIEGKSQYLNTPYISAGDRVYAIGHQDGSFPDLGWHVKGEMGGIWDHPIKLMDGFAARLTNSDGSSFCLDQADRFINFPWASVNHFTWESEHITVERLQVVPDGMEGMVVEYRITNHSTESKNVNFTFTATTDLRPTWLGERTGMEDGEDEITFDQRQAAIIGKDGKNPWYVMVGSTVPLDKFSGEDGSCRREPTLGLGVSGSLSFKLRIPSGEKGVILPFLIAGSYQSEDSVRATYKKLMATVDRGMPDKIERYKNIDSNSRIAIPDKNIEQMYQWLKYNTDWLVRHVPEQGIGLSAGLPDYPWWFGGDATYSLQGVLATGDHELVKNTILLLAKISKKTNGNGRIVHEVSTNGAVYNSGNVNETAQFITLLWTYYQWTGDKDLITQLYPDIKMGMSWLLETSDPDHNGYPNGNGMMEIPGLDTEMVDVAVYTQQALESASRLALAMGEKTTAEKYQQQADALKVEINKDWWQADAQSFGDFRGTVAEATPIVKAAIVRADTLKKPWAVAELRQTLQRLRTYPANQQVPHVVYHNWVVNTPMETGVADAEKGKQALATARKFESPFGVYVTGIDRTDEPDSVVLKSRKKVFSYAGAVMTLPTGVEAIAAARYGSPEDVLHYLTKLQRSFSYALPGSMYEVSPDFGMVTQAWNIYAVAVPIVNHFFGIQPRAYDKEVYLSPRLPDDWKEASIDRVRVGDNAISVSIARKETHQEYTIEQVKKDWTVILDVSNAKKLIVDGKEIKGKTNQLRLTGPKMVVHLY